MRAGLGRGQLLHSFFKVIVYLWRTLDELGELVSTGEPRLPMPGYYRACENLRKEAQDAPLVSE